MSPRLQTCLVAARSTWNLPHDAHHELGTNTCLGAGLDLYTQGYLITGGGMGILSGIVWVYNMIIPRVLSVMRTCMNDTSSCSHAHAYYFTTMLHHADTHRVQKGYVAACLGEVRMRAGQASG